MTGLAIAAVGIYGVVGFLVAQRKREIGVRVALGATSTAVLKLVLGDVARWAAFGAVFGAAGSWFASRWLRSLLFDIPPHDPGLTLTVAVLIVAVAFMAAWIPARRAMKVDPMVALRHE